MGDGKPMSISVVRAAGVALLVLGAVVATYAVTRWWTTESVLREAERRLEKALRAEGIYDDFAEARARSAALTLAIPLAGGRYFWWNSALGVRRWSADRPRGTRDDAGLVEVVAAVRGVTRGEGGSTLDGQGSAVTGRWTGGGAVSRSSAPD
jgi:hypothetical protein